jgi:hypothetical protein
MLHASFSKKTHLGVERPKRSIDTFAELTELCYGVFHTKREDAA